MTIIFFGNTRFSLIGAQIINQKFPISLVVTLPDRPDRKGRMQPNPLKSFAEENQIPYLLVEKMMDQTIDQISEYKPDFLIVEDYGLILPTKLLDLPKYASLNIHHSLLPKYRGTSPAPYAILNGDKITGVTVIKMNDKVDAGDILAQTEYEIKPDETTESLLTKLNELGGEIILQVIEDYKNVKPQKQDESKATFTKRMSKIDGQIDIDNPPTKEKVDRMMRAYYPWPTVWTIARIKNKEVRIKFLPNSSLRGILARPEDGTTPSKYLIQVEGGKPMSVKDFLNGYPEIKEILNILF